ncbi:hypothetical protein [Spiroplasma endosymbiont of Amphimallon solstitiale]|uniref:hypothetical protein n=1 Tax=Spiroplasma endosymbiont of Amphimallon solstitiale TaxID=3066288 RepID=UPI00313ED90B
MLDKYNINLLPNNPHGIKWKITKDGGCIIFPSNQQIDFIGYANGNKIFGKEAGGSSFLGSRTDEIIMAEEKETLTEKQLTYRYERLQNSMFRSNRIKVSKEPIKEWSWPLLIKIYIVLLLENWLLVIFIKVFSLRLHAILMINIIHFI